MLNAIFECNSAPPLKIHPKPPIASEVRHQLRWRRRSANRQNGPGRHRPALHRPPSPPRTPPSSSPSLQQVFTFVSMGATVQLSLSKSRHCTEESCQINQFSRLVLFATVFTKIWMICVGTHYIPRQGGVSVGSLVISFISYLFISGTKTTSWFCQPVLLGPL